MFNFQWRTPSLPAELSDFVIIAGGALLLPLPIRARDRFVKRLARVPNAP